MTLDPNNKIKNKTQPNKNKILLALRITKLQN